VVRPSLRDHQQMSDWLTLPWFGGKIHEVKTRPRTHGLRWALMRRPWCYFLRFAFIAFAARRVCLLTGFGATFHFPISRSDCVSGDVRDDIGLLNDGRPIFTLPSCLAVALAGLMLTAYRCFRREDPPALRLTAPPQRVRRLSTP